MDLRSVRVGDVVKCRIRGEHFYATVRDRDEQGIDVEAIDRSKLPRGLVIPYLTGHQVVDHWPHHSRLRRPARRRPARKAVAA